VGEIIEPGIFDLWRSIMRNGKVETNIFILK